jgi:hypothetical protein
MTVSQVRKARVSDERQPAICRHFIGQALQRLDDDQGRMLEEIRATRPQQSRFADRLRRLEEKVQ